MTVFSLYRIEPFVFLMDAHWVLTVMSDFRRDVDETRALLGYYSASIGNPSPMFLGLPDP
jgi:hypothetical protein